MLTILIFPPSGINNYKWEYIFIHLIAIITISLLINYYFNLLALVCVQFCKVPWCTVKNREYQGNFYAVALPTLRADQFSNWFSTIFLLSYLRQSYLIPPPSDVMLLIFWWISRIFVAFAVRIGCCWFLDIRGSHRIINHGAESCCRTK